MGAWLITTMLLAAGPPAVHPAAPSPPTAVRGGVSRVARPAASFTVNVSPATISFAAVNPDSTPVVSGSAPAAVTWQNLDFNQGNWTLTVQAAGAGFTSCPSLPLSAVTVSCSSVTTTIGGTGNCAAAFPLSTTAQTVASGTQSFLTYSYSVNVNFTLADNWKYIAETSPSCSLSLSYTANVP